MQKQKFIKSYSFYSYNLNNNKLNIIKNYAILINQNKNILSNYLFNNYKLDLFYNQLSKFDFINITKNMRKDIGSSFYQQCQIEVYTKYKTQTNNLDFKISNTKLGITINYLIKVYRNNKEELIKYLINSNKKHHKEILNYVNKYNDRLFKLIIQIQNRLLKKLKLIEFRSLTFNGINQLSNGKEMIELSENLKITNSVINLNIPKIEKIIIPCRYNKKYHGKLEEYKYSYTKQNQSQISYKCKIYDNKIKIILTKENNQNEDDIGIDNTNIIGVDVNTKNNLFGLSDNNFIKYDKWLINKYKRYQKYISRIQSNKAKRNLNKEYGKKVIKRIQKMNRTSKYYSNLKANELITYCLNKNIKHIVMENLNIKNKTKSKKDNLNYNNISKVLHLNDYKNVIKRIANKNNIMVSWVDPSYTSQICPCCGHISRENRKAQETFCCVNCNHTDNADINAAINIKNRIYIEELRNQLEIYIKEENMFKEKKYISKKTYIEIYKNL